MSAAGNSNLPHRKAKGAGLFILVWSLVADHVTSNAVSWLPDEIKISITRSNENFILDLEASRYSQPSHTTLLYNTTSVVVPRLLLLRVSHDHFCKKVLVVECNVLQYVVQSKTFFSEEYWWFLKPRSTYPLLRKHDSTLHRGSVLWGTSCIAELLVNSCIVSRIAAQSSKLFRRNTLLPSYRTPRLFLLLLCF